MHEPAPEVKKSVVQWHMRMLRFPSWQEIREIEYVRRNGNVNMFIVNDVVNACRKLGLIHAMNWLDRLKNVDVAPSTIFGIAVKHYQNDHGSQDTWLTDEFIKEIESNNQ
jgi:hypothetical protein